jgi:hypothetical protein
MYRQSIDIERINMIPNWARNYLEEIRMLEPLRKLKSENRIKLFEYLMSKNQNQQDTILINCDDKGNVIFDFSDREHKDEFLLRWS